MTQFGSTSQWDNLLCNLGAWEGSFTSLSTHGNLQADISTLVTLEGLDDNKIVRQTIDQFSADRAEVTQHRVLEYRSLGRGILLFEGGAFSQGSIQLAPTTEFGAELGFIWNDHRLRLVQLFNENHQFSELTLIREHLQGKQSSDRPPLTVEQLIGEWQGESVTLDLNWRSTQFATTLSVKQEGDRLQQHLILPQLDFSSSAEINGSTLLFDQGKFPIQVLLLPDGASCNTPLTLPKGQPFFLEAGWLINPNLRQRMIRSYDAQGGWSSLTLVTEKRVT
ncbi:MAG: DUF3598 family protein [Timaviella obliquedivisa GSE-PSE-MK23-08B]|jgi:hypothetical protein|nr:DUF3598 family protein [Timaviella obliquedivisa GSE-PSE-MK23-08B]